jgi:hypothetical protein
MGTENSDGEKKFGWGRKILKGTETRDIRTNELTKLFGYLDKIYVAKSYDQNKLFTNI